MIKYTKDGIIIGDEFISLSDITKNVNLVKANEDNLVLLDIYWAETRSCDEIHESIALPLETAQKVYDIVLGKTAYFGEIAGKHSDVYGTINENEIKIDKDSDSLTSFLENHPDKHDYNHSFIYAVISAVESGMTEMDDTDFDFLVSI